MLREKSRNGYGYGLLHLIFRCSIFFLVLLSLVTRVESLQAATQGSDKSGQEIALVGGTLIDGNGGTPVRDAVVLIKGDRITKVGSKGKVKYPKSAKTVDVTGKFILPGL